MQGLLQFIGDSEGWSSSGAQTVRETRDNGVGRGRPSAVRQGPSLNITPPLTPLGTEKVYQSLSRCPAIVVGARHHRCKPVSVNHSGAGPLVTLLYPDRDVVDHLLDDVGAVPPGP